MHSLNMVQILLSNSIRPFRQRLLNPDARLWREFLRQQLRFSGRHLQQLHWQLSHHLRACSWLAWLDSVALLDAFLFYIKRNIPVLICLWLCPKSHLYLWSLQRLCCSNPTFPCLVQAEICSEDFESHKAPCPSPINRCHVFLDTPWPEGPSQCSLIWFDGPFFPIAQTLAFRKPNTFIQRWSDLFLGEPGSGMSIWGRPFYLP